MRTLLLGSGGREHALASALTRSASVDELLAAPGNPGIGGLCDTASLAIEDPAAVVGLARRFRAELVVVGPEAPLVAGVADSLLDAAIPCFGPSAAAARIEGSKSFAKSLMERAQVPTAGWRSFTDAAEATAYLDELGPPFVIKADGLAAGKGVVVTQDRDDAVAAVEERLVHRRFGPASASIVIEEFLDGEEASVIALCDGRSLRVCEAAQDYKRVYDDDEGPNTGGMGSYSPVPACDPSLVEEISADIIDPVVKQTAAEGAPFKGALYAGLALTGKGPKVIEFNARFGDPETQALLPRLRSDLGELCLAAATGDLEGAPALEWSPQPSVCVVLASAGYPAQPEIGFEISGLGRAAALEGVHVFHSGTATKGGSLVTAGGRVLALTALGDTFRQARTRAYEAAGVIEFEGKHLRTDIALRAEIQEGETS
jgi:phosphoribosylamine---glycine ligase